MLGKERHGGVREKGTLVLAGHTCPHLIIIGFDYTLDMMADIKFNSPLLARTVKLLARLPLLY